MKLSESWKLAGIISQEVRFQAFLEANPANLARVKEDPSRISRAIKSQSRFSNFFSGVIMLMVAVLALAGAGFDTDLGTAESRLAVGFAVYLALSFVVIFFLNLTTTTGIFSSGAMRLPSTLPLTRAELEDLNFMAFVRVFIGPVLGSTIVFPAGCLLVFGPLVALVAVLACVCTSFIAIGALVRVSKWFHKKTHQTDESKLSSVVRVMASVGVVIGMVSVYSLGSYMPDMIRFITGLYDPSNPAIFTILAFIFPFAYGFLASASIYASSMISTYGVTIILVSVAGSILYSVVAAMAFRSTGRSLRAVTLGGISSSSPGLLREVKVETASPLMGMVRKDIRLATRNIGSAFLFAIPVFLIVAILPMIQNWKDAAGLLRSMSSLVAVEYANLFGGISLVSILMFDSQGASIHEGLPVSSRLVLKSKTFIMIVPYVLSMLALTLVIMLNSPITPLLGLIPVVQMPMGYAVGMVVGGAIFKVRGGGRAVAVNVTSDQVMGLLSAFIGSIIGIVPLLGYGLAMMLTGSQVISLSTQGLIVVCMIAVARVFIPRLLKD
ncbi:MAG: hypothetical protein ACFFF9_04540 [Candidatus Thorarchaeota archaeon]